MMQQQQQKQQKQSSFLIEPFPTVSSAANTKTHLHDAFGTDDSGVDYGPPNEYEDDNDDDNEGLEVDDEGGGNISSMQQNYHGEEEEDDYKTVALLQHDNNTTATAQTTTTTETYTNDNNNDNNNNVISSIEQLEEEVGLHETTLESLHTKLQSLNAEINNEQGTITTLTSDIQLLNTRKLIFRKRTDNNIKLVKELESSLDKCLDRLKKVLEEEEEDDDGLLENNDGNVVDDGEPLAVDGESAEIAEEFVAGQDQQMSSLDEAVCTENVDNESKESTSSQPNDQQKMEEEMYTTRIIHLQTKGQTTNHSISWPTTKLVRRIHTESLSLPYDIPTWRTHPLSASTILGGMNSTDMIVNVMNVAALEHLLQAQQELKHYEETSGGKEGSGSIINNSRGYVKESDIWGTSLDVYTHVNWKHLFAGFKRTDGSGGNYQEQQQKKNSTVESRECRSVDPNVILCPYELGGECADVQCPYQHLNTTKKKRNNGDTTDDRRGEGFVRYNKLPMLPKLPRSFVRDDFIMQNEKRPIGGVSQATAPSLLNEAREEETTNQPIDNRQYHCPVCVNDQITFNHDELKAHMNQCNKSSLVMVNGKSVSVRNVLRNPKDYAAGGGFSTGQTVEENASSSSDNSEHDDPMRADIEGNDNASNASAAVSEHDHSLNAQENANNNDDEPSELELHAGVEENLDYVSLPSVADGVNNDCNQGQHLDGNNNDFGNKRTIFSDTFWWQKIAPPPLPPEDATERDCQDSFDCLLLAFGFQRLCTDEKGREEPTYSSLRYLMRRPSSTTTCTTSTHDQVEDILLFSRLIDLSRVLVHMGRDKFALSVMRNVPGVTNEAYWQAYRSIKSLSHSRSAYSIFQVQIHLLLVSELFRLSYDSLVGNVDGQCLETYFHQITHLDRTEKHAENNLVPEGFVSMSEKLMSNLPSANVSKEEDAWADFVNALGLLIEKFVTIPFSQMGTNDDQLLLLLQCVCIGKHLGYMVRNNVSKEHGFVSCLHALEPIWRSLQPLLQGVSSGCIISTAIIGPVIFSCVALTVAPPSNAATTIATHREKLPPKLDARAFASLSSLDTCISEIIKELNRFGRCGNGRVVELLMAPLYAISTTISVALGSIDKAHVRLEYVLNKDTGSTVGKEQPSLYALSEMIWSQLVQIRMFCPPSSMNIIIDNSTSIMSKISPTHREVASRIVSNGIFLWGVKLRGDAHMNICSPCFNQSHCAEWEKVVAKIFTNNPLVQQSSTLSFNISDPYPEELVGMEASSANSVFPHSLLLLREALTDLSLVKCGLTQLPLSIGYHLTNILVRCKRICLVILHATLLSSHNHFDLNEHSTSLLTYHTTNYMSSQLQFFS